MVSKKKRAKKKHPNAPPLSKLDKWIYKVGYVVIALLSILLFISFFRLFDRIAFTDDYVMASSDRGLILMVPFTLYAFFSALIFWNHAHSSRKPIFGNSDITYGKAPWQNIYPLFCKERKRQFVRPSVAKFRKNLFFLWFGGFLICACLACFSLFGRVSLMQNGEITVYSSFNKEKQTYSVMDVSEFEIRTDFLDSGRRRGGKRRTWHIEIGFVMTDGSAYEFLAGDFRSHEDAFDGMLKMKTLIDSRKITITGAENLEKVIEDQNYTPEETELLYKLFE